MMTCRFQWLLRDTPEPIAAALRQLEDAVDVPADFVARALAAAPSSVSTAEAMIAQALASAENAIDVPTALTLADIVHRAFEESPADRIRSMDEFAAALRGSLPVQELSKIGKVERELIKKTLESWERLVMLASEDPFVVASPPHAARR